MATDHLELSQEQILGDQIGEPYADAQIQLHRLKQGAALGAALRHLFEATRDVQKQPEMIAEVFGRDRLDSRIYLAVERRIARETTRDLYGSAFVLAQTHISQVASAIGSLNEACKQMRIGPLALSIGRGELRQRAPRVERIHHFANFWKHRYDGTPRPPTLAALQAVNVDPKSRDALERLVAVLSPEGPELIFETLRLDVTEWASKLVDVIQTDLESRNAFFLVQHSDTGGRVWGWKKKTGRAILDYEMADVFKE